MGAPTIDKSFCLCMVCSYTYHMVYELHGIGLIDLHLYAQTKLSPIHEHH